MLPHRGHQIAACSRLVRVDHRAHPLHHDIHILLSSLVSLLVSLVSHRHQSNDQRVQQGSTHLRSERAPWPQTQQDRSDTRQLLDDRLFAHYNFIFGKHIRKKKIFKRISINILIIFSVCFSRIDRELGIVHLRRNRQVCRHENTRLKIT